MELSIQLPVVYAFARSGGTLVNRCLGSIPGNLVLSEVNPHASVKSVEEQANEWLKLIPADEIEEFSKKTYGYKIHYLKRIAQKNHYHLIIRDWSTVNFLNGVIQDDILTPSLVLEQQVYLSHYGFTCSPVVITRRAADVYESITRTFENLRSLAVEEFGHRYLAYAKAVCQYSIFHYEDICEYPEASMSQICDLLNVNYNSSFLYGFGSFDRCTGDNTLVSPSRGIQLNAITRLKSHLDSPSYQAACLDERCNKADELLGYAN